MYLYQSKSSSSVLRHQMMLQIGTSSLESYVILLPTSDRNQNRHTGDLVEHTGLLFRKVGY
jgi:hypothetical protein